MTSKGLVTLQLDHPPFDLVLGGYPTKKKKKGYDAILPKTSTVQKTVRILCLVKNNLLLKSSPTYCYFEQINFSVIKKDLKTYILFYLLKLFKLFFSKYVESK